MKNLLCALKMLQLQVVVRVTVERPSWGDGLFKACYCLWRCACRITLAPAASSSLSVGTRMYQDLLIFYALSLTFSVKRLRAAVSYSKLFSAQYFISREKMISAPQTTR